MAFLKGVNWRKVASSALAAGFVAVVTAIVHAVAPSLTAVSPLAASALVHYVDAWGSKAGPNIVHYDAPEDKPAS